MSRLLVLLSFLLPATVLAQQDAGRVLVAVGDVTIERAGARVPAAAGTPVRAGDQFQLGVQSNAQVRLADGSILALRPETTFRFTEFQFVAGDENQQRAFFDLVKGGVRTVTGVIGRVKRDNYKVVTPTSTIGIRGTHYSLVSCDASCRNNDGSLAPNGTYGGVSDGRIAVSNQAGEAVFGADQFFHVAAAGTLPQQLIGPPPFLRDTLEGRFRSQQKPGTTTTTTAPGTSMQQTTSTGSETVATVALTGLGATTGDSGVSGAVSNPSPVVVPPTATLNAFVPNETLTPGGVASTVQPSLTGTVFYRLAGPFNLPTTCTDGPSCSNLTVGDFTLAVNFALQRAYARVSVGGADGGRVNLGTPFNADGIPIVVNGGQVTFNGNFALANYPTQTGTFRCSNCGPGDTPGFVNSFNFSGTVSGGNASLTVTVVDNAGSGSVTAPLTQATPPNNDVAAIVTPRQGGGADARSESYWNVTLDGSRRLTNFGPTVGQVRAQQGSATNVLVGSSAAAGNLVWGYWQGAGAQVTDFNYQSFTTAAGAVEPWITGTATNTLPPTLGTVGYTLVGGLVNAGTGTLNSGSLTADFVNRTMSLNLNATNPGAGNTFQMVGNSGISAVNGRFSGAFNTVTCTGPCVGGTPGGSYGGFIAGAQAEGAGVAFTAGFAAGTGVSGVAAFKR